MQAKDTNKLTDESIRQMPLFILSPDDNNDLVALDIAVKKQKPYNFQLMIDLLKDYQDVCTSKMILRSFQEMMS